MKKLIIILTVLISIAFSEVKFGLNRPNYFKIEKGKVSITVSKSIAGTISSRTYYFEKKRNPEYYNYIISLCYKALTYGSYNTNPDNKTSPTSFYYLLKVTPEGGGEITDIAIMGGF